MMMGEIIASHPVLYRLDMMVMITNHIPLTKTVMMAVLLIAMVIQPTVALIVNIHQPVAVMMKKEMGIETISLQNNQF